MKAGLNLSYNLIVNIIVKALIVNTICIYENSGNIHIRGIFFVALIGADYNRCSWIYKITRFSYWVIVVVEGGGWCKVLNVRSRGGGRITKIEQVRTRREGVQILVILWKRNNWMTLIDFQLETQLFLFVTSRLLLLEFCPIKVFCQQRESFASSNINNSFHLDLSSTKISPQYWRFAQLDENIKTSFTIQDFFLPYLN